MRAFRSKCAVLLTLVALACDSNNLLDPSLAGAGTIVIQSSAPALLVGQTFQLSAVVLNGSGDVDSTATVSWTSGNQAIATISATGLIAAVALGSVTVTATSGDKVATANVTVLTPGSIPPVSTPGSAALPSHLDTSMPSTSGTVTTVAAGADLQAKLDAAQPGDVLELAAGATFTGNYVLRAKGASSSWIIIRPAQSTTQLPAEGTRMSPQTAASLSLPRIAAPNSEPALRTEPGANHYRIIGLEITAAPSATVSYGLVNFGLNETDPSVVPHDLVLDRTYIHGSSTLPLRRCVLLNSGASAVIDSYLSDCHDTGADAQAIAGWAGPGPFKILNNYLEGSGENVMFGGADPSISGLIPSDIEILQNHIVKPLSWRGGSWLIKNLIELKNAQRVLIEGNVLENSWSNGQNGTAIVMKSDNQNNTAPWCMVADVTVRLNRIRNAANGFALAAAPDAYPAQPARRITISDNVIQDINTLVAQDGGVGFTVSGNLADLTIAHNTVLNPNRAFIWAGSAGDRIPRLVIRDNISGGGAYGVVGDGALGLNAMTTYFPDGTLTGNVIIMADPGTPYPAGNFFPHQTSDVGFSDFAGGDYSLGTLSPFKAKASDGTDPGANFLAMQTKTTGVVRE